MTGQTAIDFTAAPAPVEVPAPAPAPAVEVGPPVPPPAVITGTPGRRPRDSQRQRLYDWEHGMFRADDEPTIPEDEIRHIIFRICEDYQVPQVPVIFNSRRSRTSVFVGRPETGPMMMFHFARQREMSVAIEIGATDWHRRASVICHEAAHYIVARHYGYGRTAAHGPEFAAVAIDIWERYMGASRETMTAKAAARNVKIAAR